ncbi:MAG TPA: Type 1 glutamine amidotransferase-like domain-containing protein [Nocardioides sp.]|jgi:dipeptidase E|nr:Type 1 glutamine amidotransferase-like domain-containing protein [Nocardioides sp.]
MRLFLSSYRMGAHPQEFAELRSGNNQVAVIMNATDEFDPSLRPKYYERERADLGAIGLEATELDLRDFFGRNEQLATALGKFGLVWVTGGNSFVLRRAMRQSGFDTIGSSLVRSESLVYGGYSAGAVVATPTLRHIDLVDDPRVVPDGYDPVVIYDGMGYYSKSIAPHYRSDHPESELMEQSVERFVADGMPYQPLKDGQVIVISGDEERLTGPN